MKQREGTLQSTRVSDKRLSIEDIKALAEKNGTVFGLDDFLAKADVFAKAMINEGGALASKQGGILADNVAFVREKLAGGADREAIYIAIGAALTYANLIRERADAAEASRVNKKLTRREYLRLKKRRLTQDDIADQFGVSKQHLLKKRRDWFDPLQ